MTAAERNAVLKIRCALCRRWLPANDRMSVRGVPGLVHFVCVAAYQAANLSPQEGK